VVFKAWDFVSQKSLRVRTTGFPRSGEEERIIDRSFIPDFARSMK
jgi:hypothetical protein